MDIIQGITKEPDETKYKGIDLASNWLMEEESVVQAYIYAYEVVSTSLREFNLDDIRYIDIITYDKDYNIVEQVTEWEMSDEWTIAKLTVESPMEVEEVTEEIISGEKVGRDDPNKWFLIPDEGEYRIGITNGEDGRDYHCMFKFETDSGRVEKLHFPVRIRSVQEVT